MAETTKIEWADATFNPWVGCTKVSPACDHCYAEGWAKRSGMVEWGAGKERRRTSAANWAKPLKWNREAEATGIRRRVFSASLADVFDNKVSAQWRSDLFALIEATPNLDWLLLTKRPQNIADMIWPKWDAGLPRNIWLGTTVENQQEADRRIPHLLALPAAVRFLSCEPLLGPVDLTRLPRDGLLSLDALYGGVWERPSHRAERYSQAKTTPRLDWVIVGGESGPGARPMHPDWARSLRDQCQSAGVPFFFKQWGDWLPVETPASETMEDEELRGTGDWVDGQYFRRVGKTAAGRLLDGRTWETLPGAADA